MKQLFISCFIISLLTFNVHQVFANTSKTEWRNLTPFEVVKDMGVGWNLGNSLDASSQQETGWGNPLTTQAMIDEVASMGFKTLRLPVTWRFHMGKAPEYTIESEWLDRVEEIANYAFVNDMYVIINIHHDDSWIVLTDEKKEEVKIQLEKVWTQIATRFKDYSDYLIFENLNEPRNTGSEKEWSGGTLAERAILNEYHQVCVDAIRATGGNNTERFIMLTPYGANGGAVGELIIPNYDPNTIVSIHSYSPYNFCLGNNTQTWGSAADKEAIENEFDGIVNKLIAKGQAVVLGEWGSSHQDNQEDRIIHAEYFAKACKKRGICPVVWDNGGADQFGIFNRKEVSWYYPEIAQAIVAANELPLTSGNPIIKHIRTADPAAEIWDDGKVWIYASHDQDWAIDYSSMDGYHAFSSYDLVNWTDHGEILHSRDVDWGVENGGWMFAPDAAYKNGKYYLYFPHMAKEWKWRVGVASSDKPEGPFIDQGFVEGTDQIDPCCFVDDDGTAYLTWGGDHSIPKIARLKENMLELAEEPREIEYGESNFFEASYLHKYNGKYYFSYNCNTCWPNTAQYAIGDSPYGPFEYKGVMSEVPDGAQTHHSMIEYHGQSYYFYHMGSWGDNASMYRRNVCMDSLFYNTDGTIQLVQQSKEGVSLDIIGSTKGIEIPGQFEAEEFFSNKGVSIADSVVTNIENGDWFDFVLDILGSETYELTMNVSEPLEGTQLLVLVDENVQDTITVDATSDLINSDLFLFHGKHTLKFKFIHESSQAELLQVNWIKLQGETNYFSIDASSGNGGSISPDGQKHFTKGDSAQYVLEWKANYQPDSSLVDNKLIAPASYYVFENISDNHSIKANFSSCDGTELIPSTMVNDADLGEAINISVIEGSAVSISVAYEGEGELSWTNPYGETSYNKGIDFSQIENMQSGRYISTFINAEGCKTELNYSIAVKPVELDVYQAEDWKAQNGVDTEGCSDVGGGDNVGWIENNDWISYQITIDEEAYYNVFARVASQSSGGRIELSINGEILGEINVDGSKTDGWQDWYTSDAAEVKLPKGSYEIKLTFKGGSGYLFNLNWWNIEFSRTVTSSIYMSDFRNEFNYYYTQDSLIEIKYDLKKGSRITVRIVNLSGQTVKTIVNNKVQPSGNYKMIWDGTDDNEHAVAGGIYLLIFSADQHKEVQKVMMRSNY